MNKTLTLSWDVNLMWIAHIANSRSSEIFPAGFTVIRKERVVGGGGGVFILFINKTYCY